MKNSPLHPEADDYVIIFLHIPKAAGSTLNAIFRKLYREDQILNLNKYPRAEYLEKLREPEKHGLGNLRFVTGHVPYGLHAIIPRPCVYITILRDPVERILSHYYYAASEPRHHAYEAIRSGKITLTEYAQKLANGQTSYLSGQKPSPEALATAKENISRHITLTGLTERFDETLVLLAAEFGFEPTTYTRANVTRRRPSTADISEETYDVLRKSNALDMELYRHAEKLFLQRLAENPSVTEQAARLRQQYTPHPPKPLHILKRLLRIA